MPGPSGSENAGVAESEERAAALLAGLDDLELDRYTIVGRYARFDAELRASLDELRQRTVSAFREAGTRPENFLLWGPPGSGKSYLVQQIAESAGPGIEFAELNLSRLDEVGFRAQLEAAWGAPRPLLCFVDEVDARPDAPWPYELLLSFLEPPVARSSPAVFVLAGSGGATPKEMRGAIERRPKGRDLLSRIPVGNEYEVRPLGTGDRVLVAAVQFLDAAAAAGHELRDVEKFALLFVASSPAYSSARQLRALADQTAHRIPAGEKRLRYDHLFRPGDPVNKEFWSRVYATSGALVGAYVRVRSAPSALAGPRRSAEPAASPPVPPTGHAKPTRVAVLPFRNISPDPSDSYLADGFTEEVTSTLAGVPGLEVVSRASTFRYRAAEGKTAAQIGAELNAGSLLDGSVRKAGPRLRVTAQFVDARSDRQVWSEAFEGEVSDLFKVQTEIAGRVARALRAGLGAATTSRRPPTPSTEAYLLLLKGRAAYREATLEGLQRAIALFERALQADPEYAEALAGISAAYRRIGFWVYGPTEGAIAKAKEYAERALALDPTLVEARMTLANIYRAVGNDYPSAEREIRAILTNDPRNGFAHAALAGFLVEMGRPDEAAREAHLAVELDPDSAETAEWAGTGLLYARRPAEAVVELRRSLQLDPENNAARHNLGLALVQDGALDEGISLMEEALRRTSTPSPIQWMEVAYGHLRAGHPDRVREILDRTETGAATEPAWWGAAAGIYASLGRTDDAFAAIDRALGARVPYLVAHLGDFVFDPLRSDPRFERLRASLGTR